MNIVILSRNADLYSTRRLVEAAEQRQHHCRVIDPLRCYMNIAANHPEIHYKGEQLCNIDAVIPRIGASITFYGTAVVRQFEMMGIFCLNESVAISRARDKLRTLQLLARRGIELPITGFAHSPDDAEDLISLAGGTPLIMKLLEGTQGKGVVLAETHEAAVGLIDAFRGLQAYFLVQEFIGESKGEDLRCFVVGNRVVAAIKRQAKVGEFRSNLHRGGTATPIKITPEERAVAIKASKIMGLNVAGVDLMRSERGPVVLEVNSSPGLEGIEEATDHDIASIIIKFIEKNARYGNTKTKG